MMISALPKQDAAMEQYRDIVRKHTSFTLDLLRVISFHFFTSLRFTSPFQYWPQCYFYCNNRNRSPLPR